MSAEFSDRIQRLLIKYPFLQALRVGDMYMLVMPPGRYVGSLGKDVTEEVISHHNGVHVVFIQAERRHTYYGIATYESTDDGINWLRVTNEPLLPNVVKLSPPIAGATPEAQLDAFLDGWCDTHLAEARAQRVRSLKELDAANSHVQGVKTCLEGVGALIDDYTRLVQKRLAHGGPSTKPTSADMPTHDAASTWDGFIPANQYEAYKRN